MALSDLSPELLCLIAEQLNKQDLLKFARISSQLQQIVEPVLFKSIFFRLGSSCQLLHAAISKRPQRAKAIFSIDFRGLDRHELGLQHFPDVLRAARNLKHLTIESPARNTWPDNGNSAVLMQSWTAILSESVSALPQSDLPLQFLKRLTLHLNGQNDRCWSIRPFWKALFCHPSLEELTVSYADFPVDLGILKCKANRSCAPLKRLTLIECNISLKALEFVLWTPAALEYIYLGENRDQRHPDGLVPFSPNGSNYLYATSPSTFFGALSLQKESLAELHYRPRIHNDPITPSVKFKALGFVNFHKLKTLAIDGPVHQLEEIALRTATAPPGLERIILRGDWFARHPRATSSLPASPDVSVDDPHLVRLAKHASQLGTLQEFHVQAVTFGLNPPPRNVFSHFCNFFESGKEGAIYRLVLSVERTPSDLSRLLYGAYEHVVETIWTSDRGWSKGYENYDEEIEVREDNPSPSGMDSLDDTDLDSDSSLYLGLMPDEEEYYWQDYL